MAIRFTRTSATPKHRLTFFQTLLRKQLRLLVMAGCVGTIITSSGCSILGGACKLAKRGNHLDDCMIGYRNNVLAAKAWHNEKHCFKKHAHISDLKNGFMQGYSDVATGSNGCVPAVAPSSYMGWKYQTPDGQARVNAWFEGYPLGVRAAERDGVGNWGQIRPMGVNSGAAIANQYPAYLAEEAATESPFYEEGDQRFQPIPDPASGTAGDTVPAPEPEGPEVDEASPVSPADLNGFGDGLKDAIDPPVIPDLDSAQAPLDLPDAIESSIPSATVGDTSVFDAGNSSTGVERSINDSELPFSFE